LPRQTTGTDAVLAQQATENTHPAETDAWASATDVVVPKPYSGIQVVSRQMLDMSSPAVDALIYSDMISVYNSKIEAAVGSALVTAAGTAVTTFATEAAFTGTAPAMPATDAVLDAAIAVRDARKLPPDLVVMGVTRYGRFLKLTDTTGRPVIPETAGPMNVLGVGSVNVDGRIQGLGVIASDGVSTGGYPDSIVVLRAADTVLFESNVTQFRFEEVAGPESIKLGIWAGLPQLVGKSRRTR
jgi:HK97 family phage major capsid protein